MRRYKAVGGKKSKSNMNNKESETTTTTIKAAVIVDSTVPLSQKESKAMKLTELKEHLAARQLAASVQSN
jgi:hypothetical protein